MKIVLFSKKHRKLETRVMRNELSFPCSPFSTTFIGHLVDIPGTIVYQTKPGTKLYL